MQFAFRTQQVRTAVNGHDTADELTPVERELARKQWEQDNPTEVSTQRPAGLPTHSSLRHFGDGVLSVVDNDVADRARELLTDLVKQ